MGYSEELGGDGTIDNNSSVSDFKISIFNFKYCDILGFLGGVAYAK
jgi:hypothetical protein